MENAIAGMTVIGIVVSIFVFFVGMVILRAILGTGKIIAQGEETLVLLRRLTDKLAPEGKSETDGYLLAEMARRGTLKDK